MILCDVNLLVYATVGSFPQHSQGSPPGPRHLELSFSLLRDLGTAGNLTTDIQLAALAIEHQAELHSADADFARMKGLRWVNPLAPAA